MYYVVTGKLHPVKLPPPPTQKIPPGLGLGIELGLGLGAMGNFFSNVLCNTAAK